MKKILVAVIVLVLMASNSFAISMVGGYKSSGQVSTDVHVTTQPSKVFAVTMTPTSANGFARIVEVDSSLTEIKTLVYVKSATSGNTIHLVYPEGINCANQLVIDPTTAIVTLQYKDS